MDTVTQAPFWNFRPTAFRHCD